MFRLVLSALRARRSQTVALFALTVLAGLGGLGRALVRRRGPATRSTQANIAAAPAEQRTWSRPGAGALRRRAARTRWPRCGSGSASTSDIPGADVVVGAQPVRDDRRQRTADRAPRGRRPGCT